MQLSKDSTGIEYLSFNESEFTGTINAFFTRNGGVSEGFFSSLNIGGSVGDNPDHVLENKRRVVETAGRNLKSLYEVFQIHSTNIVCTNEALSPDRERQKADGIFTSNPEVTLLMRFADCVPIIFYEPVSHVVGIVHAGWQGTVQRIIEAAVTKISNHYLCDPANIVAGIGPSIGPDHYEIGFEVIEQIRQNLAEDVESVIKYKNGHYYFDLWKANTLQLLRSGVSKVINTEICTACDTSRWFSHRAEHGKTGRFAVLIGLKGEGIG